MQLRYAGLSTETQRILDKQGEAGRFEFKQDAEAVKVSVLVAAANACVLERLPGVTILVGVAEQEDPETGVVTGHVVGLRNLTRAKELVTGRSRSIRPVPPKVEIVEENTKTKRSILRVTIAPTRAPHYDDNGARTTRQGASTRAITDEELLELYLDREAESFERRFRRLAESIEANIDEVASETRALAEQMSNIETTANTIVESAGDIQGHLDETYDFVASVLDAIGEVQEAVAGLTEVESIEEALAGLLRSRTFARVWLHGRHEVPSTGKQPPATERQLIESLASQPPALMAYRRNLRERDLWITLGQMPFDAPTAKCLAVAEQIRQVQAQPEA